jgi:hypothetical protein
MLSWLNIFCVILHNYYYKLHEMEDKIDRFSFNYPMNLALRNELFVKSEKIVQNWNILIK